MQQSLTLQQRFHTWLSDNPDDTILRWIFRSVVAVTAAVLVLDLASMNGLISSPDPTLTPAETRQALPEISMPSILPAILTPLLPGGDRRLTPLPQPDGALGKPMTFELIGGGRLLATGSITPGISESFATEISKRSDYIKTVVLNSPGGSVADALAMGRLIRDKKFATEVDAGKYCASSCPLVFAGGVERRAGEKAAIGVHQVFAVSSGEAGGATRDEMSDAQRISARCQRYLTDMGINPQMWVHAMETPKDKLFIFKPDELKTLNIVTSGAPLTTPVPPAASTTPLPASAPKTRS